MTTTTITDDDVNDNINQNEFHADHLNPFHLNLLCRFIVDTVAASVVNNIPLT